MTTSRRPFLRALLAGPLSLFAPIAALAGRRKSSSSYQQDLERVAVAARETIVWKASEPGEFYIHGKSLAQFEDDFADLYRQHPDEYLAAMKHYGRGQIALAWTTRGHLHGYREGLDAAEYEAASLRAELAATRALLVEAREALAWTGGASDFNFGNAGERGWHKVVRPVIDKIVALDAPRQT